MGGPLHKLFFSAVSGEFGSHRLELDRRLRDHFQVYTQEHMAQGAGKLLEHLDEYIKKCDAVVHLVGRMRGHTPTRSEVEAIRRRHGSGFLADRPGLAQALAPHFEKLSYTQWEAVLALYHKKPCFIFKASYFNAANVLGGHLEPKLLGGHLEPESTDDERSQGEHLARLTTGGEGEHFQTFEDAVDLALLLWPGLARAGLVDITGGHDLAAVADFVQAARRDYAHWRSSVIFSQYAQVHVNLDSIYLVPEERELIAGRRRFERYSAERAVQDFDPLLMIGEPGTGKTTCLRQLTARALEGADRANALLPLFVPIFPVISASHEAVAIAEELIRSALRRLYPTWGESTAEFWERLKTRPFLLLFDGLNEIPEELIPAYCASIAALQKKLTKLSPDSRTVISSRIDNLARGIDHVRRITKNIFEVQKLTDDEALRTFVDAQIGNPQRSEEFLRCVVRSAATRSMAQNAFLLTGMITIFTRLGRIPNNRSQLMSELADLLLGSFGSEDRPRFEIQREVLADLAFELRSANLGLGAPRTTVDAIVSKSFERLRRDKPNLMRVLGSDYVDRIVVDLVDKRFLTQDWWYFDKNGAQVPALRFWLEVIQEYFAAIVVARTLSSAFNQRSRSARAPDQILLRKYIERTDWHQVLALAIGIAPAKEARWTFEKVCRSAPLVAGLCLAAGLDQDEELLLTTADGRIRRIVRATSRLGGVNRAIAIGIAASVFWLAITLYGGGWPVGGLSLSDLVPLTLRMGSLLLLFGLPLLVSALERYEEYVLENVLPNQYIQPLLRALITAGTARSIRVLSRLERDFSVDPGVPRAVRAYIMQANRIWRFGAESREALLTLLHQPLHADYAIDRLEQLADPGAIRPLLDSLRSLLPGSAQLAVRAAVRLCQVGAAQERENLLSELRAIQNDRSYPWRVRLAAFLGRRTLGEASGRPPACYYLYRLQPNPRWTMAALCLVGFAMTAAFLVLKQETAP